ncbi:FAD-binding oxidoreductase [Niveispirillum sp.]|uniref:NAD(P)/FAD-dependent oxidoreductase n=1 Tax=Niveispirillum sp. TaxID=1917217 RepID=UPI001B4C597E|nr:FAD-binding oxidoreductase [Niveispirillum sp.]MBP7335192.1 FAD-binding oxidoreductase [Niveispirillum sp.]
MSLLTCDFLVIGAGMAGLSAAAHLSSHGSTLVLEQEEHPGYHATGRSAAIFVDSYGVGPIRTLTSHSRRLFESGSLPGLDLGLLTPRGLLYVTFDDDLHPVFADLDYLPRLSPAEVVALAPILKRERVCGAFYEATALDMDVHGMQTAYLRHLRRQGGTLITGAGVHAARRLGGVWQVETKEGSVQAPIIVNAAGAWAGTVAGLFGAADPGLVPKRRSAAIIDGPAGADVTGWPMVADMAGRFYFKPEGGKLMLSPAEAEPTPPSDAYADDMQIAIAADHFQTVTGLDVTRVQRNWAGLRTFAPDEQPVIGFDPTVPGLFWLAGQGGFGIQTAPAAAALTAALVTGTDAGFEVAGWLPSVSPARFGG